MNEDVVTIIMTHHPKESPNSVKSQQRHRLKVAKRAHAITNTTIKGLFFLIE